MKDKLSKLEEIFGKGFLRGLVNNLLLIITYICTVFAIAYIGKSTFKDVAGTFIFVTIGIVVILAVLVFLIRIGYNAVMWYKRNN